MDEQRILNTEIFHVVANPTHQEIVQTMGRLAKFCNQFMAECLKSGALSAANPASAGMMNASTQLETGAVQLTQLLQQQAGVITGGPQRVPQPFMKN